MKLKKSTLAIAAIAAGIISVSLVASAANMYAPKNAKMPNQANMANNPYAAKMANSANQPGYCFPANSQAGQSYTMSTQAQCHGRWMSLKQVQMMQKHQQ